MRSIGGNLFERTIIKYENHINGQWLPASDGATFEQRDPADLSKVTGVWPQSPAADAAAAVEAAQAAYPAWRELGVFKRSEYLKRALSLMGERREEIAGVITMENGKTLAESLTEIDAAVKEMEFQIHAAIHLCGQTAPTAAEGVFAYQTRVPLGVVSVISPWNFPFNVPGRKCTPALMAGNTVVFKPASLTPRTGEVFTRLMVDAGLPDGVFNFVTGGGSTVGETFTTHPAIKAISFTGSTEVGKRLNRKASANLTRTQLELGGKNPMIILEYIEIGRSEGAEVLTGGGRMTEGDLAKGCFIEPTVFGGVRPEMRIAREEIFGPVLSIITVKDFAEALEVANGVEFGLASAIYTRDLSRAMAFLEATDVGLAHVNMLTAYKEPQLTFGGVKDSGFGVPEAGKTGIEFFTEHKVAYVKYR